MGSEEAKPYFEEALTWARDNDNKVGLWNSDGSVRLAANAFSVVAQAINNTYTFDSEPAAGPNLYHYRFHDPLGQKTLEFAWTTTASAAITFTPPPGFTQAVVTDYLNDEPSVAGAHSVIVSTHTFGCGLHDRLGRIWRCVPI